MLSLLSVLDKLKIGKPAFAVTTNVVVEVAVTEMFGSALIAAANAAAISVLLAVLSEVTDKGKLLIIPLVTSYALNTIVYTALLLTVPNVTVFTSAVSAT